ncbi:hypothetical protein B0H17DRAFT_1212344 [Mycena rosella]|uniref:DUF6533 domain-containing protein n=1 Tax=Mycena rosella TaxID=1033263 RepID=A0AAD7CST5_MYCRO|nr:hypothetical protein B0H17DRAFT_1212344 [Mycena rosella]
MSDAPTELVRQIRTLACLHLLGISLMYYDHLLTLGHEISLLWKRARSASAHWFFAVRYAGFAGNIPVTVFIFYPLAPSWSACHAYHTGRQVVLAVTQLLVSIVMLIRIYALYGRNVRVLALVLVLSTPLLAVIVWSMLGQHSDYLASIPGCHVSISRSTSYHLAAAWEALFVYDALIFGLTVFKTYSTWRRAGAQDYMPLHTLILRDGALYFAAMALANLCNIITFYMSGPILAGGLSTFASCMSVALMSRLMLNLHKKARVGVFTHLNLSFEDGVLPGAFETEDTDTDVPPGVLGTPGSEHALP